MSCNFLNLSCVLSIYCCRRPSVCSVCLVLLHDNGCREVDHEDDDNEDDSGRGFPLLRVEGVVMVGRGSMI